MKKSDWALIVVIVAVVGLVAYFATNSLLPNPVDNPETVETASAISSSVVTPDETIFGENAINPAVETSSDSLLDEFFRFGASSTETNLGEN